MLALADLYSESLHVQDVQLDTAFDDEVWQYSRDKDLVIVSKDADFGPRSFAFGHPPKVIWVRLGNCSTAAVESLFREHVAEIRKFIEGAEDSFLALG